MSDHICENGVVHSRCHCAAAPLTIKCPSPNDCAKTKARRETD